MDKKEKEALVMALLEKGETYREITKKAGVSPNTIKAIANKVGLSEITSESSRVFELYVQQKTPLEVAIALNIEADKAIHYYHEYFKLLGITEFTRVYLQIKDNPLTFVNFFKLCQNSNITDGEVVELLKIANGYLPRIRLEYDRVKEEKSSLQAELNSWKAELNNIARTYQQFCDRNLELKKREDELQLSISELERKETRLNESLSEFQENADFNLEVKEEEVNSMINVLTQQPNMAIDYHPTENNNLHHPPQFESSSSRTIIFDTKDLF
jgi:predicted transcriptional regulator